MQWTPIYEAVAQELAFTPHERTFDSHEQFMDKHDHEKWLLDVLTRSVALQSQDAKKAARRPAVKK
jgi:hypothetical protein